IAKLKASLANMVATSISPVELIRQLHDRLLYNKRDIWKSFVYLKHFEFILRLSFILYLYTFHPSAYLQYTQLDLLLSKYVGQFQVNIYIVGCTLILSLLFSVYLDFMFHNILDALTCGSYYDLTVLNGQYFIRSNEWLAF